jgi:hypothetical protein
MSTKVKGPLAIGGNRDAEGHRTYWIKWLVKADDANDGPATVLETPGLFLPGAVWDIGNDYDPWAWCRPEMELAQVVENERNYHWTVKQTFSTKLTGFQYNRCQDVRIEDPLLEPQKVSGSFNNTHFEATFDRFDNPIRSSSWELLRGNNVEFDRTKATVKISQNVPILGLDVFSAMINTLNDRPLWGMSERKIKLANVGWERTFYGFCNIFYRRDLEFEIDPLGHDRDILDEGNKALNGHWGTGAEGEGFGWVVDKISGGRATAADIAAGNPNRFNPAHFVRVKDKAGHPMRVILDGSGRPVQVDDGIHWADTATTFDQGTGYALKDRITLTGGTFTQAVILQVTSVGVSGNITGIKIYNSGNYTVIPSNHVSQGSTTGGGTGGKFDLTWASGATTVPGNIHIEYYPESNFLLLGIPTIF